MHIQELHAFLKQEGLGVAVLNTGVNKNIEARDVINISSSQELFRTLFFGMEPRVIHLHLSDISNFAKLIPIYLLSLFRRFRWVVTVHSGNIESKSDKMRKYQEFAVRLILRRIHTVICVNHIIKNRLSLWTDRKKLALIPAFSLRHSETVLPERLDRFIRTHSPILTCTGFYEPLYGFNLAIDAISEIKKSHSDAGLMIMGDKKNSDACAAHIRERGLTENVLMCGNVSHAECLMIIKNSRAFLRPTWYDGDAISVREALALQTPVVASETEFRPEGVYLFRNGDVEDMVRVIKYVLRTNLGRPDILDDLDDLHNLQNIKKLYALS